MGNRERLINGREAHQLDEEDSWSGREVIEVIKGMVFKGKGLKY